MLEAVSILLAVSVGWMAGYMARSVNDRLKGLQEAVRSHVTRERTTKEPTSMIVEPLTPEQQARKDLEERVKRLNP